MTKYAAMHHCIDKPAYPTQGEAVRKLYSVMLQKGVFKTTLQPYECLFGNHYHLGNTRSVSQCSTE